MGGYTPIALGAVADDSTGSPARAAGGLINTQFQEIYGFVGVAPLLAPNDNTKATANRTALNAAIAAGNSLITPCQVGDIFIDQPLIGYSNMSLLCGPGTNIRLKAASSCPMFMPLSLQTALAGGTTLSGGSSVTLTQGVGCAVTVAMTGHGFTAGDGAWIYGSTVTGYNGVLRVASVTDTDHFVVYTDEYQTSAPAGTILCTKAVENCRLGGGTWNYDYLNQTFTANSYNMTAVYFAGTIDSGCENITIQNCFRWSLQIQACRNFDFKGVNVQRVGVGIYGPCANVRGEGLYGSVGATLLTMQTNAASPGNAYQFSHVGSLIDISIKGVNGVSTTGGLINIVPSDAEHMDGIHFEQVYGCSVAGPAIQVARSSNASVGAIGRLTFKNCSPIVNTVSNFMFNLSNASIDILTFEHCSNAPGSTLVAGNNGFLTFAGGVVCGEIVMDKIRSNYVPSNSGSTILIYANGVSFKNWRLKDCVVTGATTGNFHFLTLGSSANVLGKIVFEGGFYDATCNELLYCNVAPIAQTIDVLFKNVNCNGAKYLARTSVVCNMNVKLEGNTLTCATALVSSNQPNTVNVSSDNTNTITLGTLPRVYEIGATTPTLNAIFNLFGNELIGDQASVGRAKGSYFNHSSTASGHNATAQQGLCYCPDSVNLYAHMTSSGGMPTLI